ncbi:hypothetical protein Leryth_025509 [Lithospermum erythrorhizon]|nr:hypothetical protein Leryth_025509 [Lithospermum erythrorhizon]
MFRMLGGLILLKPDAGGLLQYAATASFLSKLYSDYLELIHSFPSSCPADSFSPKALQDFSMSQVNYILGDNPKKLSYMVGFGKHYSHEVHHRGASIPSDGQWHSCVEGERWLNSKEPNPNDLLGAMVAGPDRNDNFFDERSKKLYTEPSISGNAGLVAALIALHELKSNSSDISYHNLGVNKMGIFRNIRFA